MSDGIDSFRSFCERNPGALEGCFEIAPWQELVLRRHYAFAESLREFIPVPLRTMDPPLRVTTSGDSGCVPTLTFLDDLPHFSAGRTYTHDFTTGAFWVTPEPEPLPVFRSLLDMSAAFPAPEVVS